MDGFTYEFYKDTKELILPVLTNLFNNVIEKGCIPNSWSISLITLIPKKADDLTNVNNWRPISLINTDAKIFMKVLANRLNTICDTIIGPAQQAFIAKRSIADSASDILTVLRNQTDQSKQHWLLLLDQQKAFDRVNHQFLQIVLEKMNFDHRFIRIISSLFATHRAHIVDKGRISSPFRVERGVRQGDPLSPLLYVLAINPLIHSINLNIRGIPVKNFHFKISAYADDLSIGIGSVSDWANLNETLKKYEEASNASINKSKTILLPITDNARRIELPNQSEFKAIDQNQDSITILGYEINMKGEPSKKLWAEMLKKIKNKIQFLAQRNLSLQGKILVAKTLLISKIWYLSYLLPPSRKQLGEINKLITNWIKNKSRMLPQPSTFQRSYEQGGLAAPILRDLLDARLISVFIKLFSSESFWANTERDIIHQKLHDRGITSISNSLSRQPCKNRGWPDRWKPYIVAWGRFKGKILVDSSWPWPLEQIEIQDLRGNHFSVKSILKNMYNQQTHNGNDKENRDPNIDFPSTYKWIKQENILNKKKDIFWRLSHRALPLGYRLAHISPNISGDCPNCPHTTQTLEHFSLKCSLSKTIWSIAYKAFKSSNYNIPSSWRDIFEASNISNPKEKYAAIWLHITTIYEIWCWYTQANWGNNLLPAEAMVNILKRRLKYEFELLRKLSYSKISSKSKAANKLLTTLKFSL